MYGVCEGYVRDMGQIRMIEYGGALLRIEYDVKSLRA